MQWLNPVQHFSIPKDTSTTALWYIDMEKLYTSVRIIPAIFCLIIIVGLPAILLSAHYKVLAFFGLKESTTISRCIKMKSLLILSRVVNIRIIIDAMQEFTSPIALGANFIRCSHLTILLTPSYIPTWHLSLV